MHRSFPTKTASLIAPVLLAAALAGCAGDQGGPGSRATTGAKAEADAAERAMTVEERFARLDRDGDGSATWEEVYGLRARQFRRMDTSGDGVLDGSEYRDRALPFRTFDLNGDGGIDQSEWLGTHRSIFQRFDEDGNGNGTLEMPEFQAAQQTVRGD